MASIYLHIPFCEHKCIYCDFYSIESQESMDDFLQALHREIEMYAEYGQKERVSTIFFGGGTPSLLAPDAVGNILEHLHREFSIESNAEVTLEANPGTVDRQKLAALRNIGVNRLSFGVQSFDDNELKFLTRIHSSAQAVEAVEMAKDVGFRNISIDLIFAIPGQTMDRWKQNLQRAVLLDPQHISAYSLIVERGTPLDRMVRSNLVTPLPVETEAVMYEVTMAFLRDAGFQHYEVSNYAKPGFRSIHNSNYWNHTNYLGFGPSAHSFWSNRRWWNVASIRPYIEKLRADSLPIAGQEQLTAKQLLDEKVMLGLRSDGINFRRVQEQHGVNLFDAGRETVEKLLNDRLAILDDHSLRLTDKGFLLCDAISERLLSNVSAV